jgi:hypothetical protein
MAEKDLCGAQLPNKAPGRTCRNRAGFRTEHFGFGACYKHLGESPNGRRHAAVLEAGQVVRRLGLQPGEEPVKRSPVDVLFMALWQVGEDLSMYQWLVSELDAGELTAETYHMTGQETGEAKRNVLVQLMEDAELRAAKIASECIRLKIAHEHFKVAQERAVAYSNGMRALVQALGHSPTDPGVRKAMRASMQLVSGQTPQAG